MYLGRRLKINTALNPKKKPWLLHFLPVRGVCYLATVVGDNEVSDDKNEGKLLSISTAMAMQWYDTGRIPW